MAPLVDWWDGHERCALLVAEGGTITRIVPVPNRSKTPTDRFYIRLSDLRAVARDVAPHVVVGHIHTHPGGDVGPSDIDLKYSRFAPRDTNAVLYLPSLRLFWYKGGRVLPGDSEVPAPPWVKLGARWLF